MDGENFSGLDAEAEFLSAIAELAGLPDLAFALHRPELAARFEVPLNAVDRAVRKWRKDFDAEKRKQERGSRQETDTADQPAAPVEHSDDDLAWRLIAQCGHGMRYTAQLGKWHHWTGAHWEADEKLKTFTVARAICRRAAQTAMPSEARGVCSAQTVAAVERLARSHPGIGMLATDWDANPWLLATPDGTVDLKTGELRAADPVDNCTKITAVAPGSDCPRWLAFLDQIMAGDQELVSFLQRVCGYALTGSTKHHALFFLYGTGGNGKSVFLSTISAIIGAYAKTAAMSTFAASANESHPTDIAGLKGARLVISQETEQGQQWAESKIKTMTGGDVLSARYMRQDFFEFRPQFKLLISGNHKPELRNVDEAIRRRFFLIPFTISIPREQQDENLAEKLRGEWPGILRWMIDGCLDWQRIGLAPPRAVMSATDEYLASEDSLAKWIEECCIRDRSLQASSPSLFASWSAWCEAQNERRGSQKQWHARMVAAGYRPEHGRAGNAFAGIGLKPPPAQEWEPGR